MSHAALNIQHETAVTVKSASVTVVAFSVSQHPQKPRTLISFHTLHSFCYQHQY